VVREDEFLEALTPGRLATRKLATRAEAAERVERWRRAGCRVGFLVGSSAAAAPQIVVQARSWCDRLVVGLGDADPTAATVAEMPGVDLIARFGGETPLELIRLLRPDVLVQDPGRGPYAVSGGDLVQEWGGTVRRATPEPEPEPTEAA
jgi:D-beta-D-heptose 7-phosphate kinase / D-beta-D-heptose 1-phosphate adenosyltransferase